jgi:hypothetical protein
MRADMLVYIHLAVDATHVLLYYSYLPLLLSFAVSIYFCIYRFLYFSIYAPI